MKLTVFTPTYNRQDELRALYDNIRTELLKINTDFVEWIIVDDGSDDNTKEVVRNFSLVRNFEIKYFYQKNSGKHVAFNLGIEHSEGDIFICMDDDDRFSENAISMIFCLGKKYRNMKYGGFVGRPIDLKGKVLGKKVFEDSLVSNTIEIRDKYKFWGEPEIFYTKYLKKFRFEVFEGEKFLTEAFVFDRMSKKYPFVYTNEILMVKHYLPNGLTNNQLKIRIDSPCGCEAYYYQRKILSDEKIYKLKAAINRQRFIFYIDKRKRKKRKIDLYDVLGWPIARLMIVKDKKIRNRCG